MMNAILEEIILPIASFDTEFFFRQKLTTRFLQQTFKFDSKRKTIRISIKRFSFIHP